MRCLSRCVPLLAVLAFGVGCGGPEQGRVDEQGVGPDSAGTPVAVAGESLQVFTEDSVDVPPSVLERGQAKRTLLPPLAQGGRVRAEFVVKPDSTVCDIRVTVEEGPERLRDATIETIENSRFSPALKDGRPVACRMVVFIDFRMKDAS